VKQSAQSSPAIWWITHEFFPFRGGAGVYVEEVARAAANLPVCSQVVAADYRHRLNTVQRAAMNDSDSAQPFPVVRLKCSGRLTPAGIWRLAVGIHGLRGPLGESAPVLMSVGAQMAAFLLHAAGRFPAGRATCFFHGSELLRFARHPFWRSLARRFYSRAAGFAVASQYVRGLATSSGLLPADPRICVAPCAVPSSYRDYENPVASERDPESVQVLTVGRLHPRKGQVQVAQALASLPSGLRRRLVYRLVGAGDPSYRRRIEAVCRDAGVRSEFLGDIDERALATVYSECTIYAQASQTLPRSVEGFGISLLEAGFFGCPIAAFRSGGVAEAVREGVSATLVNEGDVAGLGAAIETLIADPDLRRRYGAAGREYARGFAWSETARTLCDFSTFRL
jgi:phosphatidylinositol alpha-1,6-mannosyltransferase